MLLSLVAATLAVVALPQSGPDRAAAQGDPIDPPPGALVEALHLAPSYAKHLSVEGLPVLASAKVSDFALREAAFLIRQMVGQRPEILAAIAAQKVRFVVMAPTEMTTDVPEHSDLTPRQYWNRRARGLGSTAARPAVSCGEENLLDLPGDPYATENILIHEFAHTIHEQGMRAVDPTFDPRLRAAYEHAQEAGRWKGTYAMQNRSEYWAEVAQSWFDCNRSDDHDHGPIDTRAELVDYDPEVCVLLREVFGDRPWRYTKPGQRPAAERTHLAGFDVTTAGRFTWPKADRPVGSDTRTLAGWTVHVSKALLAEQAELTARALELLEAQLDEIVRVVPAGAVVELRKVPLWISPEYDGTPPRAEYHPAAEWLRANRRHPAMAKAVEFTNVRIFAAECRRMPAFALHELAHAYHDRVLGYDHGGIRAAYERAKASGKYAQVERQDAEGRKRLDRAYALTNAQEFFAEATEAFFARNDFFPYTRAELEALDPETGALLAKLWGVDAK